MKKILLANVILGAAAFGFAGCAPSATNTNKAVITINTNTAVTNSNLPSNMNSAMNSNAPANMNSAASSSLNKNLSSDDKDFMSKAAQGGMAEVKLGELAFAKGQSPDVKTFGQKMKFDHTKANGDLMALADGKAVTLPADVSAKQKQDMDKLSKLSGAAFDKEYVRMMIEDHEKDVADFQKQAEGGTNSELKTFASSTLPTLQMHLAMIKGINERIK